MAIYPFVNGGPSFNFMELAKLTGLGGTSIIGVVLHPTYGPWMAFRTALILDVELDLPGEPDWIRSVSDMRARSCIACVSDGGGFISRGMGFAKMPDPSG